MADRHTRFGLVRGGQLAAHAVNEFEARVAIRHLQSVYNTEGDRGRIAELVEIFSEDGALEVPGAVYAGKPAIAAFLSGVAVNGAASLDLRGARHHLTTSRIEFDGHDAARGWTYFLVTRAGQILQEGTYIDNYCCTPAGWRIAQRRVKILWTLGDRGE